MNPQDIERAHIVFDRTYGTSITIEGKDGLTTKKYTSIDNVQEALLENFQFATGFLPAGTRHYVRKDTDEVVFIESPPSIRRVSYYTGSVKEYTIPIPWTIWSFKVTRGQGNASLTNSMVWAMKGPITPGKEKDHELYVFPFSNVNTNGICWGGGRDTDNALKSIDDISKVGRMIEIFWSASFNRDLDGDKYSPFENDLGEKITHCHGLLEYLDGKKSFCYDKLKLYDSLQNIINKKGGA